MSRFVYLIPLFPLVGFLFNLTIGTRVLGSRRRGAHSGHGGHGDIAHASPSPVVGLVACGTVFLSLVVSVFAVYQAQRAGGTLIETLWTWLPGGAAETAIHQTAGAAPFQVDWAYQLDPLSSVMALVVTFVGLLIHVYSVGYMAHDPGYARYMSYLNLFMFAMLTLVLGANYAVLFVGWEGVGLCSYLLIGFWYEKQSASDAGKKAFIVNRIGDAFFLLGLFLIFMTFGSLDFRTVSAGASHMQPVWLPDAMEGPTPVSALIHAATMVTAGVYMVARSAAIYTNAPNALFVVAVVGAFTAIFAASIGLVQNDIKRVLAYSTVSQLGYMFLACGVGAFAAGIFHLATHAFFKALLFLGSGSVIHGMSGEQDMRKMGGLRSHMPWTHRTMLVGCIAIAGFPPFAGFFSKDEILWSAFKLGGYGQVVWAVGFVAAGLTAFYMFRLYHMTFGGTFRGTPEQEHHLHESPPSMVVPLQALAVGSMVAGFLGVPAVLGGWLQVPNLIEEFLHPAFAAGHGAAAAAHAYGHGVELGLMAASVLVAVAGWVVATRFYDVRPDIPARLAEAWSGTHRVLLNKYYVDEIYDALFVKGAALGGGRALHGVDRFVVDGGDGEVRPGFGVNGLAWMTRDLLARFSNAWDKYVVDGLVNLSAFVLDNLSYLFRAVQNGLVQHYVLVSLIGVFLLIGAGRFVLGLY
jgi:NADH-quinone oxidoreductase subunit L